VAKKLVLWWRRFISVPGSQEACDLGVHNPVLVSTREVPVKNPKLAKYGFKENEYLAVCSNPACEASLEFDDQIYWAEFRGGPDWRKTFNKRNSIDD